MTRPSQPACTSRPLELFLRFFFLIPFLPTWRRPDPCPLCNTGRDCSCQAACERCSCGKPGAEAQNPLFSMNRDHISVEGGLQQAQHSLRNLEFNPSFALDSLSEEDSDLPHRAVVRVGVCNGSPRAQGCAPRGLGSFLFIPISYALCTCSQPGMGARPFPWQRGSCPAPPGATLWFSQFYHLSSCSWAFRLCGCASTRPGGALGVLQPGVTPNCSSSFHLLEVVTII